MEMCMSPDPLRVLQAALAPSPPELREVLQKALGEEYREIIDFALAKAREVHSTEGVSMAQAFSSLLAASRHSETSIAVYVVARLEWEETQARSFQNKLNDAARPAPPSTLGTRACGTCAASPPWSAACIPLTSEPSRSGGPDSPSGCSELVLGDEDSTHDGIVDFCEASGVNAEGEGWPRPGNQVSCPSWRERLNVSELRELVLSHVPTLMGGVMQDHIDSTGGLGLCREASEDLQARLGGEILWLDLLDRTACPQGRWTPVELPYPRPDHPALAGHAVLRINNLVVDLTAQQIDEELPFPFIWSWPHHDQA
jgi:hypothetical protein